MGQRMYYDDALNAPVYYSRATDEYVAETGPARGRRRGGWGGPSNIILGLVLLLLIWLLAGGWLGDGVGHSLAQVFTRATPAPTVTVTPRGSAPSIFPEARTAVPDVTGPDSATEPYRPALRRVSETLRVRNAGSISLLSCFQPGCRRVATLRPQTRVEVIGESVIAEGQEWVQVRTGNLEGWVSRYDLE